MNDEYLSFIAEQNILLAEDSFSSLNSGIKPKDVLELGGAGGITKTIRPDWIISDVRLAPGVDLSIDAVDIPFGDNSFDMIYAVDVIHHVADTEQLLRETSRVLRPNGIFFVREPYWGFLAQFVWRFLHPEKWSLKELRNKVKSDDPMAGNQALAQALVKKQKHLPFNFDETDYEVKYIGPVTGLAFLLSGGATFTTKVPRKFLITLSMIESRHRIHLRLFGFGVCFYFIKKP